MVAQLYGFLAAYGYHHPLHPVLTHLPVGLTLAGFVFILIGYLIRRPDYAQTAHHCTVLALVMALPTAIMGYLDWRHFYAGAALFEIKAKIALALALLITLAAAISMGRQRGSVKITRVAIHLLAVLVVVGLGYFGAELVYGKKTAAPAPVAPAPETTSPADAQAIAAGEALFKQSCSFCHFSDNTDTKVGPGLQGLFQRPKMAVSQWPVNPDNVRRQLRTPFEKMPAFESLSADEIDQLITYLATL